MPEPLTATTEPVVPAPVVAEPAAPPLEDTSVSAHRAQFDPKAPREPLTDDAPALDAPRERHRAKSQQASADEYQEIASLTKTLREKETALRTAKPDAVSGSPRLLTLKRQIKAIEAELADLQPKPAAPPARVINDAPAVVSSTTQTPATGFSEPEPKLEAFEKEPDPYAAYLRAQARYDRRKDDWEANQQRVQQQQAQASQAQVVAIQQEMRAFGDRVRAFAADKPEFASQYEVLMREVNGQIPDALGAALVKDDNGPAFLYTLASDPVFRDDMILLSDGKPVTDALVALLRRRLSAQVTRTQAAQTGSAAAMPPSRWTSRPPNPVRTSPGSTGDVPPGDGHSIAEHRHHFSAKPRR